MGLSLDRCARGFGGCRSCVFGLKEIEQTWAPGIEVVAEVLPSNQRMLALVESASGVTCRCCCLQPRAENRWRFRSDLSST